MNHEWAKPATMMTNSRQENGWYEVNGPRGALQPHSLATSKYISSLLPSPISSLFHHSFSTRPLLQLAEPTAFDNCAPSITNPPPARDSAELPTHQLQRPRFEPTPYSQPSTSNMAGNVTPAPSNDIDWLDYMDYQMWSELPETGLDFM